VEAEAIRVTALSVIVATYNRATQLRACLESLAHQTLPAREFEVVVVVDGSTDATRDMLAGLTPPYRLISVAQPNRGQPTAANEGIRAATGSYCLFLDDDVHASPELLRAHLETQRARAGVVGIGAMPIVLAGTPDWFARGYAAHWNAHYARLDVGRPPSWNDAYGGNLSAPRTDLLKISGFATDLAAGYDIELAYRLIHSGLTSAYIADGVAHQHELKSGRGLAAALEREGEAAVELSRRHPTAAAQLLGRFVHPSARAAWLRRMLLNLDVPAGALATLGPLLPNAEYQRRWWRFVASYCYWRGVRRRSGQAEWSVLSRGQGVS